VSRRFCEIGQQAQADLREQEGQPDSDSFDDAKRSFG